MLKVSTTKTWLCRNATTRFLPWKTTTPQGSCIFVPDCKKKNSSSEFLEIRLFPGMPHSAATEQLRPGGRSAAAAPCAAGTGQGDKTFPLSVGGPSRLAPDFRARGGCARRGRVAHPSIPARGHHRCHQKWLLEALAPSSDAAQRDHPATATQPMSSVLCSTD